MIKATERKPMDIALNINFNQSYHREGLDKQAAEMTTQSLNNQLDAFLRTQQNQAYTIALMSVRQESDAMDVIQETMMSFVNAYKHKPQNNWKPLFYRILQNKINDHHRKQKSWLRHFFSSKDSEALTAQHASQQPSPLSVIKTQETGHEMIALIKKLPEKQQQVVLYRHWQQMTVEETASIMQISAGSVKTHLFRATKKLKQALGNPDD